MSDVREDLGYLPASERPKAKAPPTDLEVLRKLGAAFEGTREADPGVWIATVRRKNGKACGFFGATEAVALTMARRWVDAGGMA